MGYLVTPEDTVMVKIPSTMRIVSSVSNIKSS